MRKNCILDEKFFLLSNITLIKAGAMIKYLKCSQMSLVNATHSNVFKVESMSLAYLSVSQRLTCLRGDFCLALALVAFNNKVSFDSSGIK